MTTASAARPLLTLRGVSKYFPGVRALEGVEFDLRAGEIHALMGENGAGKSTFVKILSGVHRPDGGDNLAERRGDRHSRSDPCAGPRHQPGASGTASRALSQRGGEHFSRPPADQPLRAPRLCRDEPQCGAASRRTRRAPRSGRVGRVDLDRAAPDRRHRPRDLDRVPRHHLRRADLLADRTRGEPPLRSDPAPEPPGHRRDLHLAPDGGDLPPLRPGDGISRWALRRDEAGERDQHARPHRHDDWPRPR